MGVDEMFISSTPNEDLFSPSQLTSVLGLFRPFLPNLLFDA